MDKPNGIILAVIAVVILMIALPIMETNLVDARAVTGASSNFQSAIDISQLVLGFAPIGLLLWFLKTRG
jgi:hypothetical protein